MRKAAWLLALALVLGVFAALVWAKERHLAEGRLVLLKLRPVDPRSLIQGDYMQLAYDEALLAPGGDAALLPRDGRLVLLLDADGIATGRRLDDGKALAPGEVRLRFRVRGQGLRLGAESYFFQEGLARAFEAACYGQLSLAEDGASLLVGLADRQRRPIRPGPDWQPPQERIFFREACAEPAPEPEAVIEAEPDPGPSPAPPVEVEADVPARAR